MEQDFDQQVISLNVASLLAALAFHAGLATLPNMKTKVRLLLMVLLLTVLCWGVWQLSPAPDPLFHGKPETVWIKGIDYNGGEEQTQRWREFGPDGIRVLIRGLEKEKAKQRRQYVYDKAHRRLPFGWRRWLPYPEY